jgi:mycofactocin system FadH/OYE family oxidoreductase 2
VTTSSRYPLLFSPLRLGPITVANRIVFSAHLTNYAEDGLPTAQHAAYYAARAAGGAGLIITEEHSVHPTDWPYEKLIHGFHPEVVPGYRHITDAVHRHGTPILAQINHNGGQASGMYSRLPVWGPSPVADPLFREVPKAVDHDEIDEIVAGYALVAGHCRQGGFDGVELQCSHSSIVRGFLSPATNRRDDDYGGSLQNRAGLLLRIVAAVRATIGAELALGVRLCGDELIEGGTTIDDAVAVARLVAGQGLVDYVNTSIGVATASLFMIEASMHVPPGYASFIPSAIRDAIDLPVVGVGRFKDPLQAERALEEGHCDLVGVVRGQIADAEFAAKARAGHTDDIRLCLSCNQECVGRMGLNRWLGCIENPHTGRESEKVDGPAGSRAAEVDGPVGSLGPTVSTNGSSVAKDARPVVVVGGGPAGLQAAIAAAERGRRVVVLERDDHLGGQVRLAATVPNRAELGDLVRNQVAACRRLGVDVRTDTEADVDVVRALAPAAVVVATGASPLAPYWVPAGGSVGGASENGSAVGGTHFADVCDVLTGAAVPNGDVLVIDELGFHQATSVAELLADRGCSVEIATPGMVVGQDLGITLDFETFNIRAAAKGITQSTDLVASGVDDDGAVQLLHHPTGRTETRHVDWVVLAVPQAPDEALYRSLRHAGLAVPVHRVGDCVAPRRAHAAVIEGQRVGASL